MTIQQCRYAVEISKVGSFNEAATRLFVSQASLSESVKNLEQELGIVIFERSNKGINLTREGTEFIHYAAQLVSQAEMIRERYSAPGSFKRLCIATQHYDFAADVFAKFLNSITQSNFSLTIQETKTHEVIENVKNSLCDIGIIAIKKSEDYLMKRYLAKNRLEFHSLTETNPHIFVRKEHPLSLSKKVSYDDLGEYPYVFYEQGENSAAQFSEELSEHSAYQKKVRINDRATLMNLLLSTDCYTIGTGIMTSDLNNGNVISIPLESDEKYEIGWINHKNVEQTDEVKTFIEMLEAFFENIEK